MAIEIIFYSQPQSISTAAHALGPNVRCRNIMLLQQREQSNSLTRKIFSHCEHEYIIERGRKPEKERNKKI